MRAPDLFNPSGLHIWFAAITDIQAPLGLAVKLRLLISLSVLIPACGRQVVHPVRRC